MTIGLCLVLAAGCSRKPSPDDEPRTETPPPPAAAPDAAATTPTLATSLAPGEVQLAGMLGCGHCNFHSTSECATAMKTASGDVYVIDGAAEGSTLFENRMKGGAITVIGSVLEADGAKHIAMTSFEMK
jgi:hypothetical protein